MIPSGRSYEARHYAKTRSHLHPVIGALSSPHGETLLQSVAAWSAAAGVGLGFAAFIWSIYP